MSYVFLEYEGTADPMTWAITTWSRKVSRSEIKHHGTPADKEELPEKSSRNIRRTTGLKRKNLNKQDAGFVQQCTTRKEVLKKQQDKMWHH